MYYAKWMENLAKQDTKLTKAYRLSEYRYLWEASGLFMCWEKKYYIWHLIFIGVLFSSQLAMLPCGAMTMIYEDELAVTGQVFNNFALAIISLTMTITAHLKRKSLLVLLSVEAQGYYNYGDSLNLTELNQMKKLLNIVRKALIGILPVYFFTVVVAFLLSDYYDAFLGYELPTTDYVNGVYQHLPLKLWMPFTIDSNFKWTMAVIFEEVFGSALALCFTWLTVIFTSIGQNLIIQTEALVLAIRETDSRANRHYTAKTGQKPPSDPLLRRKDPELMKSYRACIKQTMEHHKIILFVFQLFADICYWPAGVGVLNGAILLAMSAITLTKGGGRPSFTLTSTLLIVAEICVFALLCEFGERLKNLGKDMFYAMYEFQWRDCSKEVTTDVKLMMTKMSQPLILYGALTPLNRDTFAKMMNTAYSYVNLVRAS